MAQLVNQEVEKPLFVIVAGPNGAGKSTFSKILVEGLTQTKNTFVWDADLEHFMFIAEYALVNGQRALEYISEDFVSDKLNAKFEAAKADVILKRQHFAIETNLYPNDCLDLINEFKTYGYKTVMLFMAMSSPEYCFERVVQRSLAKRVDVPNHFVPFHAVKIKYECGLLNFNHLNNKYKVIDKTYVLVNECKEGLLTNYPLVLAKYQHGSLVAVTEQVFAQHELLIENMVAAGFVF
jgi:predicted ABC-type ATPase